MKKTKGISFLLAVAMLITLLVPDTLALSANAANADNNGMYINKTATANDDGTYTIQLEAYATGDKVITETKKDVPTDIVLVLDQSGSMAENMNTYSFRAYSGKDNGDYYNRRHNGGNANLYYPLEGGSYASVSVTWTRGEGAYHYTQCSATWYNYAYYDNGNNLYVKSGEEYQKVTLNRSGGVGNRTYTYTFPDNTTIVSNGSLTSPGNFNGKGPLYVLSIGEGEYTYEYTYTDKDGVTRTIGASTGANTEPGFTLYERYTSSSTTRLAALKTAVTNFANSVKTKAAGPDGNLSTTTDNVNHRIAVVGFATGDYTGNNNYPTYENTEVFVGATQYNYNTNASTYYGSALQDMNTQAGYNNVIASKNALAARGATYPNYGLEMAKKILDANPVPQGQTRNRVVILFTDGSPGYSEYSSTVANAAVATANTLKSNGVTVYSVGIFEGADASSAGIAQGNSSSRENQFMQNVSSNNGTPRNPSYYLSASDAGTLNSIFQQISENIESGGSSTTLSSETVIKDIIADQFELPAGATADDITLETYLCTGKSDDSYTWSKNSDAMGANATVNETDGTVSVSGFDFAANYVGTVTNNNNVSYRGHKLVIKFNVKVKDGFLGGNDVYTNASAGVYENSSATEPVLPFNRPQVNVQIKDVAVTAADKNVYLLSNLTADQIKDGATVKCGNVSLNLTQDNYGLENWQTEYVDITVEIKDKDGNIVMDLNDLSEDTTYSVSAKVSPKTTNPTSDQGTKAVEKTGNAFAAINVFKPELIYKDSTIYYGDTAPTDYSSNLTSTEWKHDGTVSTDVTMVGTAPTLDMTYAPEESKIQVGKINTKQDIAVDVAVKIDTTDVTDKTTFVHTKCDANCSDPVNGKFWLHVKTCQLTVTKTGGAADESYVFNIFKDGQKYTELSVWGNGSVTIYELPVGSYTIEENEGWSWRYDAVNGSAANLTAQNSTGSITCNNTKTEIYWLNGFSTIVQNIFGQNK